MLFSIKFFVFFFSISLILTVLLSSDNIICLGLEIRKLSFNYVLLSEVLHVESPVFNFVAHITFKALHQNTGTNMIIHKI